jgi:hypothetical protein
MRKTGDVFSRVVLLALLLAAGLARAQGLEFYQTVDRDEVGLEDTFRLTVVLQNAPRGAKLELPEFDDFEVLSRTPVDQTSISVTGAGTQILRITKWVIVLRARKVGRLTIGASTLDANGERHVAKPVQVTVKRGTLSPPQPQAGRQPPGTHDPFQDLLGQGFGGGLPDPSRLFPDPEIPRSDSDLFLRTYLDSKEAFVGQQVNMSVYLFSRVDVASVESVTFPQLEGFWSEDIDSPTNLTSEQRVLNGVPYRAYLLKRKALFPMRAGTVEVNPVQAEISTGYLFAGHKVNRKGNKVSLEVKPLPAGAPKGFSATNVGRWKLSVDVTPVEVSLGEPVTVKVSLEGRGNVKNAPLPRLEAPAAFRTYEPTTTDRISTRNGVYGGRRTQEYIAMPTQTGTFTFPELTFPYFDPETRQYAVARTEPVTVRVSPGKGGAPATGASAATAADASGPKNVLTSDGIHPVRHGVALASPGPPAWRERWFLPALLSPVGLWAALGLFGAARSRLGREDEGVTRKKKAKAARRRLLAAEKLRQADSAEAFFAEVERALYGLLEARFGEPLNGLTHDALSSRLAEKGVPEEARAKVRGVLEACELGRFAPGGPDLAARDRLLDEAEAALEALERR